MGIRDVFSFGRGVWDPSHRFETSWLLPPYLLGALRGLFGLYILVVNVFVLGWECRHSDLGGCAQARDEFSYFTVLTYWGLGFYFVFAAKHTLSYAHTGIPLLDRFPRPLQALHALFYTTVTVFPFVVTAVYWGDLYTGPWFPLTFDAWRNISQHAMNSAFALFEILLTRAAPQPWIHILWLILILALYLGLAYITRATKGFYVYNFLDPNQKGGSGLIAAYVFGIAVGTAIIFALVKGVIFLRLWLTERKLGMTGKFARGDDPRRRQAAADVELAQQSKA